MQTLTKKHKSNEMQTFAQFDLQKHDTHNNIRDVNFAAVKLTVIIMSAAGGA
jgi:hypothetical protein